MVAAGGPARRADPPLRAGGEQGPLLRRAPQPGHARVGSLVERGARRDRRRRPPRPARRQARCCTASPSRSPRGRVTGLLGPSGCGKTTLMRAIVGVQIVESGRVEVLGEPAGSRPLRAAGRLRDPGALGLRRPQRAREPALLRAGCSACGHGSDRRGDRDGRARRRRPTRSSPASPAGSSARASLATALLGEPERAGPRRADRRPRPGAAPRPLGDVRASSPPPARRCSSPAT